MIKGVLMKTIGIINFYNGKYGTIINNDGIIDFECKDISLNQKIKIGDTVEFRVEIKFPNIKLARNINKIEFEESQEK